MSYVDGFAKVTGQLGEAEADRFFKQNGLLCFRPSGKDIGIDRIIKLSESAKKEAKIQIKGRRQEANPRWFQLTVTSKQQEICIRDKGDLNELWRKRISMVDFWVLVSIPLNEIWIFPSAIIFEFAEINARIYCNRRDNNFDQIYLNKQGKIEKKQKELNLNVMNDSGNILSEKYSKYKNNFSIIIDYLKD
jgi:hypothetical protein